MVHATLSLTGISMLIASHPLLFMVIKCCGALYLGWLGWGALMAARQQSSTMMQSTANELRGWAGAYALALRPTCSTPRRWCSLSVCWPPW